MVCTFDGDGPLVSFMHATNDTSRRSNGSRQGRNEKKKGRAGKKILFANGVRLVLWPSETKLFFFI